MNRESALLGVPTWSMFTGRRAAIDEELARRGLLGFLEKPEDLDGVAFERRTRTGDWAPGGPRLLYDIENMIRTF
jgi:predicted glycosyltransferase